MPIIETPTLSAAAVRKVLARAHELAQHRVGQEHIAAELEQLINRADERPEIYRALALVAAYYCAEINGALRHYRRDLPLR